MLSKHDQHCKNLKNAPKSNEIITCSRRSPVENNHFMLTRQSRLEHFGFDMLPRSTTILKRQSYKERAKSRNNSFIPTQLNNKTKKMRTIE